MNASCICVTEVRILFARFRWHYSLLQCHCSILFQIPGVEHVRTKVHAQGHKDHMVRATVRTITLQAGPECYFFLRSFLLSLEQVYKIEDQPMRRFVLRHAAEWGLKVHSWADVWQIWPAGDFFGVCVWLCKSLFAVSIFDSLRSYFSQWISQSTRSMENILNKIYMFIRDSWTSMRCLLIVFAIRCK